MTSGEDLEARAEELFAEFLELRERGEDPDLAEFLARDPEAAPHLEQLVEVHQALFPTMQGEEVGDYRLRRVIGRGGMGVVYEAEQISLSRRVAIKFLPRIDITLDPRSLERFQREMAYLAKLEHPHIVPVFDAGQAEGRPYFVMPLLRGRSLAELIAQKRANGTGGIEEPQATRWMEQITSSLKYIHDQGIIHRDLKPSNVFLCEESGDARLLDFGLARSADASALTLTGQTTGTPAYMSPEQLAGDTTIGPATDLYLLGATFYEATTGHRPFEEEDRDRLRQAILRDPPPLPRRWNPRISRSFEAILLRCLHKDPKKRFPSAEELVEDLQRLRERRPIRSRPPSPLQRYGRLVRKAVRDRPLVTSLLLLLVLVATAAWALRAGAIASPSRIDRSAFAIETSWNLANHRITSIKSSTDQPLFPSLLGETVVSSLSTGQPLVCTAELEPSNEGLEVVWSRNQLDLRAAGYAKDGTEEILWELSLEGELEAWNGFGNCLIYPAPGLLETGRDALVLVLGKLAEPGAGFETSVLIVDSTGNLVSWLRTPGIVGWANRPSISGGKSIDVCDVGTCYATDDRPELLLSGYRMDLPDYPHPVLLVLKPFFDERGEQGTSRKNMRVLEYLLPVSANDPEVDAWMQEELRKSLALPGTRNAPGLWQVIHAEDGVLAHVLVQGQSVYYYVENDPETRTLEWIHVDYGDGLRKIFKEYGLDFADLPFEGDGFEAMRRQARANGESWF